jgi:hypothetical protein
MGLDVLHGTKPIIEEGRGDDNRVSRTIARPLPQYRVIILPADIPEWPAAF